MKSIGYCFNYKAVLHECFDGLGLDVTAPLLVREEETWAGTRPVLFLPGNDRDNPYQPTLAAGLRDHGWQVEYFAPSAAALAKLAWLSSRNIAVIHVHWPDSYIYSSRWYKSALKVVITLLSFRLLKLRGSRLVYTVHNLAGHEAEQQAIESFFFNSFLKMTDSLIVHCNCAKGLLKNAYSKIDLAKVVTIPHGHYRAAYPEPTSRTKSRIRLEIGPEERVFLYLGNIRPYKGVDDLVDAFALLKDPQARLIVAGRVQGHFDATIALMKSDSRITFMEGFVSDKELVDLLSASDVFVVPFKQVLTSGSIILAMSFGLPCIAPNVGCIAENLQRQRDLTYDPSDSRGLSKAIEKTAIYKESDLRAIGKENQELAEAEYNWVHISALTASVYDGVQE